MNNTDSLRVLVIGFGNPAREDDGLGPAAVEMIEQLALNDVTVENNYQLTVEDAAAVSEHDVVVFIDASVDCAEPFSLFPLLPKQQDSFSTHEVHPETVLWLAHSLFGAETTAYILEIRGYSFSMFNETMTVQAGENLNRAVEFLVHVLESKNFQSFQHYGTLKQPIN